MKYRFILLLIILFSVNNMINSMTVNDQKQNLPDLLAGDWCSEVILNDSKFGFWMRFNFLENSICYVSIAWYAENAIYSEGGVASYSFDKSTSILNLNFKTEEDRIRGEHYFDMNNMFKVIKLTNDTLMLKRNDYPNDDVIILGRGMIGKKRTVLAH